MKHTLLNAFAGLVVGVVLVLGGAFLYARLGFIDPRADIPVSSLESSVAMKSLDASLGRRTPEMTNPLSAEDSNLAAGMKLFQLNCAGCHGDVSHPESPMARAFYPRPPQFQKEKPDMPENQNFYLIRHGIRYSGMPAWERSMSDKETWQVVTFLSHMDKLPPSVRSEWTRQSQAK